MKIYLTNLLLLIASIAFFACNNSEVQNRPIYIETPIFNPEEVSMDEQMEANEILSEISEFKTSKSKSLYDEYYGGGFMDKNGFLTIMVKGDTALGKKIVDKKRNNGKIKFVKCKYSLAELNAVDDSITSYVQNNKNATSLNLTLWFANEMTNTVEVYLLDTTKTAVDDFKAKITDSPMVKFMQGEPFEEEKTTLCCDSKISLDVSTGNVMEPLYGSFAFRAREKNGQRRIGMVTAAHVISTGECAYLGDNNIGLCIQSVLSGKIDAAFIAINDLKNYEPSNYITDVYNILSISTSNPGIGTIVNKYGAKTKHTTGTIVSTNGKVQASNGNTLTNMTFANYESA